MEPLANTNPGQSGPQPGQTPTPTPPPSAAPALLPGQTAPAAANPAGTGQLPPGTGSNPPGGANPPAGGANGFGTAPNAPAQAPNMQFPPEIRAQLAELNQLRERVAQMAPLAQMGYQQYQTSQQAAQTAARTAAETEQKKSWFNIPQFDRGLLEFLSKDEAGNVVARAGAPPDAVFRYQQWAEAGKRVRDEFFENPQQFLESHIRRIAGEEAGKQSQQQLSSYQDRQVADRLISADAGWIFNDSGDRSSGLSPYGERYSQYVQQLQRQGVTDTSFMHEQAKRMVKADVMEAQAQQQQVGQGQQQAAAQAQQQFLQNAGGGGSPFTPAPSAGGQQPGVQSPPGGRQMSLKEQLAASFNQNGINDRTLVSR